jgi:PilZ domain
MPTPPPGDPVPEVMKRIAVRRHRARSVVMEHRWGRRVAMRVQVRLIAESGVAVPAEMENASISGAFVRTAHRVPLGSRLEVELTAAEAPDRKPQRIAAHVARRTRAGVAVEWCELAPAPVRALLATQLPAASRCRVEPLRGIRPSLLCISE